jgi:hypothetical protein
MSAFAGLVPNTIEGRLVFWTLPALPRWRPTKATARSAALGVLAAIEACVVALLEPRRIRRGSKPRNPGDRWPDALGAARPSPNLQRRLP